jgi:hypothetical protein
MALRVISLQSSASVAFGEKLTSTGRQSRLVWSRMTQLRHRSACFVVDAKHSSRDAFGGRSRGPVASSSNQTAPEF